MSNTNITPGMQAALEVVKSFNENYEPCVVEDVAAEMGCTVPQAKGYIGSLVKAGLATTDNSTHNAEIYAK
jgi:Mn-dependent DtxR family transcriptional regulator